MDWVIGRNGIYIEPDIEYIEAYKKSGGIINCAGDGRCGYIIRPELACAYARMLTQEKHNTQTLNRTQCGSEQNLDVEHRLMQTVLKMQGPDGLLYIPIKGRPWALPDAANPWAIDPLPTGDHWCSVGMNGRWLGGFCTYALKDPAGPWADAVLGLARALIGFCVVEGDVAWLPSFSTEPGRRIPKPASPPRGLQRPGAGCQGPEYGTTGRVIERAVGSFSGWPSVNDFVQGKGWSIMHCCTGNSTRVAYYVWEKTLTHADGKLKVNLLLNRASRNGSSPGMPAVRCREKRETSPSTAVTRGSARSRPARPQR